MARLGKRQLELLSGMAGVGNCLVVPSALSRSLIRRGLMQGTSDQPGRGDSLAVITAAGYRALADAIDAGLVQHKPDWAAIRARREEVRHG